MKRVIILMLDSCGIGGAEDASKYNDAGSNTLGHILEKYRQANFTNMANLGLIKALEASCNNNFGQKIIQNPQGIYGFGKEISTGKDTISGHWELMGYPVTFEWGYFTKKTNSFPQELLATIYKKFNIEKSLANCVGSGTEILNEYGEEHIKTGYPIFYTSADSVFQIAAHEQHFGLQRLYDLCHIVREELYKYNIGRVIARPFFGEKRSEFIRTGNRKDLSIEPQEDTLLDIAKKHGLEVTSIGKISDIFAGRGITTALKATGLEELFNTTVHEIKNNKKSGIIFTNFVDFDSNFGHRRDVKGYKEGLEYIDSRLPEIITILGADDLLVITADHGCDPTWKGSDHTREHIPIIFYNKNIPPKFIGGRETFADVGQSIATYLQLPPLKYGQSFL